MSVIHKHKKDTFWQILIPLIVSTILVITLAVFMVLWSAWDATGGFSEKWGGISLIYLSLPAIAFALVLLALLIALIYLAARLYRVLPGYASSLYTFLEDLNRVVRAASEKITNPAIGFRSKLAGIIVIFKKSPEEMTRSRGIM